MGFTTPCFIRKNTKALRMRLEELGYKPSRVIFNSEKLCLATAVNNEYAKYTVITNEMFDSTNPHITWNCAGRIDCGINDELFLAIAALRGDNDCMQWFTNGGVVWFRCIEDHNIKYYPNMFNRLNHKATVWELIEHCK